MTQDEFETLVKQYFKEGTILYIVAPESENWLTLSSRATTLRGPVSQEIRQMARIVRDTAIQGGKVVSFSHLSPIGHSNLETEVDVVATVGFDLDGSPGTSLVAIKKWRGYDAIPSPGVWPLTN
ncbi:hypothetical protein D5Q48_02520 [Salmonella enterica subsp. enterica serovar Larochelle]|nr:hypothetical protein [Salmonella enterica subsp. enterica serovar Larochelle]